MGALRIRNIGELITCAGAGPGAEERLGLCRDAVVVAEGGVVRYAGPAAGAPAGLGGAVEEVDAGGRLVTPGLCDPHTHPIWAGERGLEFDLRNQGRSYAELQAAGGGILSTVRATAAATDEELVRRTRLWLSRLRAQGVTRCEVKTGYGLWPEAELRLLRLLREAGMPHGGDGLPRISPTFLCHVPPPGLCGEERRALVEGLGQVLPAARREGAEAVDVYCDQGAFTLAETEHLLTRGREAGLALRCHAEQFTHSGAAAAAARLGARSVEHLEEIDDAGVAALREAGTVANLLPGAVVTLRLRWPDARRLLDQGVRVALGTDLNPGSSLCTALPTMMMLACTQMGLRCAEALLAVTVEAARAVDGEAGGGRLLVGEPAELVLWDVEQHRELCQHLGGALVARVFAP